MIKVVDNKLSIDTKINLKKARKKIDIKFIMLTCYYMKNKE